MGECGGNLAKADTFRKKIDGLCLRRINEKKEDHDCQALSLQRVRKGNGTLIQRWVGTGGGGQISPRVVPKIRQRSLQPTKATKKNERRVVGRGKGGKMRG